MVFCPRTKRKTLRVLPVPDNFGLDALLPVTKSYLLEWGRQNEDVQKQCSLFSESHILAREFFQPGKMSGLVALAKNWKKSKPEFTSVLSTLNRIFANATKSGEVVLNAGHILEALFENLQATEESELVKERAMLSKELPRVVEFLLRNVVKHAQFIARDSAITNQLVCMASNSKTADFAFLAPAINEFWTDLVELTPSNRIAIHNVDQVKFSETARMYIAGSESMTEPLFEKFFKEYKQPSGGVSVDFEHLLLPIPDAAEISRTAEDPCCWASPPEKASKEKDSLLQSLLKLQNIDNFGGDAVQAIVKFKWHAYAKKLFLVQFFVYIIGLALLVAISLQTWASSNPEHFSPAFYYSSTAFLSYVYFGIMFYTARREWAQFRRTPFDESFCKYDWLDFLCGKNQNA